MSFTGKLTSRTRTVHLYALVRNSYQLVFQSCGKFYPRLNTLNKCDRCREVFFTVLFTRIV